ncbi:hypothetical protein LSUB1_G000465 [Lachnellula subtilissima]|uniref:NAD(P)-binding domain-containing protein n=1 Tax=Lachnellula subtilissima TaxID=602034 RepID=A0A8H8S4E7_9HELO|nr:hypothetical protein LSUB1_G000465 [Lachnellula subtilissima]
MKLIVAGSTGFVATEVIRQALSNPAITSIKALARRPTDVPQNSGPGADVSKLKSVVCDNFEEYPESVKQELAGADACIWLIAITPSQISKMTFLEARKICLDYTVKGLETMTPVASTPFRFLYTSGANSERDATKKPWVLGDFCLMRGECETAVLDFAAKSQGKVQPCIAKPGLIDAPGKTGPLMSVVQMIGRSIIGLPKVQRSEVAATLLHQAVNGIEKETLFNEDLVRIGGTALAGSGKTGE